MSRLDEALSPLDSLFLHLESPRTPMHSGFVGIVEGGSLRDSQGQMRLQDIRAEIDHRLHLVPKLRQRVRFSLLGETTPGMGRRPALRHRQSRTSVGPVKARR